MSVKLFQVKTNIESVSVRAGVRKTFRVCSLSPACRQARTLALFSVPGADKSCNLL